MSTLCFSTPTSLLLHHPGIKHKKSQLKEAGESSWTSATWVLLSGEAGECCGLEGGVGCSDFY